LEGPGSAPGTGADVFYKQEGSGLSGEFGPLLDQAYATLSSQPAGSTAQQVDAESFTLQLQSLPQGGKQLPLQQTLDSSEYPDADTQQLMEQIAARPEQLQSGTELNPTELNPTELDLTELNQNELNQTDDSAVALPQLAINVPASQAVVAPQAAILAGIDEKSLKSVPSAVETTGRTLTLLLDRRPAVTETGDKPQPAEALLNAKNTSLDKALVQFQQQAPEQQRTELASLMAAFNRRNESPAKPADTLLRADAATTTVTTPPAVQSSTSAPSGLPTITLGTPLNQSGWDQALGERIQWMASNKLQGARIRLNPANLGPMEVRVQVQNEQASIQFTSAHGVVREALEAALPRLRDMFDASGVELVDVDVSGQSFAEQQRTAGEGESAAWGRAVPEPDSGLGTVLDIPLESFLESGRLDLFA